MTKKLIVSCLLLLSSCDRVFAPRVHRGVPAGQNLTCGAERDDVKICVGGGRAWICVADGRDYECVVNDHTRLPAEKSEN